MKFIKYTDCVIRSKFPGYLNAEWIIQVQATESNPFNGEPGVMMLVRVGEYPETHVRTCKTPEIAQRATETLIAMLANTEEKIIDLDKIVKHLEGGIKE